MEPRLSLVSCSVPIRWARLGSTRCGSSTAFSLETGYLYALFGAEGLMPESRFENEDYVLAGGKLNLLEELRLRLYRGGSISHDERRDLANMMDAILDAVEGPLE